MNKIVRFVGVLILGLSLFSCKDEKGTAGSEEVPVENVAEGSNVEEEPIKAIETVAPWENLYEQEPTILKSTAKILKVDNKKAINLMAESSRLVVKKDALETVLDALRTTSAKDYLSDEFNKAVIANGGKGVGLRVDVSPNAAEDGSGKRGNFYQFSVYENYDERINTVGTFIYDLRTMSFYEMDVVEADYVPLKYATSKKKSLAEIVEN